MSGGAEAVGGTRDLFGLVLALVGLAAGIVAFAFKPFLFGPLGVVCVGIALVAMTRHRSLAGIAMLVVGVGFLVGAAIAVATGSAIY